MPFRALPHLRQQGSQGLVYGRRTSQHSPEPTAFNFKVKDILLAIRPRCEFSAMPKIEVLYSRLMRDPQLLAAYLIFVSVHDRPQCVLARKLAGKDAILNRGSVRLPLRTSQVFGECALNLREAQQGFSIVFVHSVPEAPQVLHGCVTLAVEEGVLQTVCFIPGEPVSNVHHVARLKRL